MKTIQIELTKNQASHFDWAMGLPVFQYSTSETETLEHERDISQGEARNIIDRASLVKLSGLIATLPVDADWINMEMVQELERLINMMRDEGYDDALTKGKSHRDAQLYINAQIKSIETLISKLESIK